MNRRAKVLLMGIIAVIVVAILIAAYFASQPEVKWWKPEKEMKKPDVDFSKLDDTIVFERVERDVENLGIIGGSVLSGKGYYVGLILSLRWYDYHGGFDIIMANLTAWAERVSGDYILEKLVIEYNYGSEMEDAYTTINYESREEFRGANLWYDITYNTRGGDNLVHDWCYNYRMVGVNKDAKNADFYGVSFPIEILLEDPLSMNLTRTITFTVTAYYGHPTMLGWTDMHELKTQVVLKIVPGGEKE